MSKRTITKITQAHAVAICRRGANPEAHVLLRKSADITPSSSSKEPEMSIKSLQKIAAFDEATRKHFVTLNEADATAFLEKSAEDQAADVAKAAADGETAKAVAAEKSTDAAIELTKSSGGVDIAKAIDEAIAKAVAPFQETIAILKKSNAEHELRKMAGSLDFRGYPGGEEEVFKKLEAISGLSADQQTIVTEAMKAQAAAARGYTGAMGLHVMNDISKSGMNAVEKKASELRKADPNISQDEALAKALEDDELLMKALEDEVAG